MSWYRTYRPQKIEDLHLESVRTALERIRKSGEFSHAYLFAGPKGTGKTSSARILSKMLNCKKNEKHKDKEAFHEPCNECELCRRITQGNSVSVLEMDAASNRGIDDIRALRDSLNLAPSEGKYTVYIIDEVHMLTTEAFNALLKVLEEPPTHVVFILATTELHKLPETIISRCTYVPFKKATDEEMQKALAAIAEKEKISISKELLAKIAKKASGSFRDGVKIFEQVVHGKKEITEDDVNTGIGGDFSQRTLQCKEYLYTSNSEGIVTLFKELEEEGRDFTSFQKSLLESLHTDLLSSMGDMKKMQSVMHLLSVLDIPLASSLPIPYLPLEIACLKACMGEQKTSYTPPTPVPKKSEETYVKKKEKIVEEQASSKVEAQEAQKVVETQEVVSETLQDLSESSMEIAEFEKLWIQILESIRPGNASLEALLKASRPKSIQGRTVTLEVFYAFHKDQLSQEKYRKLVEQCIGKLCGIANIRVQYVLGDKNSMKQKDADTTKPLHSDSELESVAEEAFL